jgi:4-coumarate--CoA ligase
VIGLPDEGISGELPRAYVVLRKTKEADSLTPEQVIEWFNPQVSKYKRLDGGVKFIDAIPKTGSGKMLKRLLRETAVKEVKDEKTKAKL